jgi:2-hydroxy-3-oxopropionate reductase
MGSAVTLTGPVGAGNTTKLANQIMVACNIAAMGEALVLATRAGLDPEVVFNAVKGGLAGSTVLNVKAPMVIARNFHPGFRIELHQKDLRNALLAAANAEATCPPIPLDPRFEEGDPVPFIGLRPPPGTSEVDLEMVAPFRFAW